VLGTAAMGILDEIKALSVEEQPRVQITRKHVLLIPMTMITWWMLFCMV
jgi:hypothetical protein